MPSRAPIQAYTLLFANIFIDTIFFHVVEAAVGPTAFGRARFDRKGQWMAFLMISFQAFTRVWRYLKQAVVGACELCVCSPDAALICLTSYYRPGRIGTAAYNLRFSGAVAGCFMLGASVAVLSIILLLAPASPHCVAMQPFLLKRSYAGGQHDVSRGLLLSPATLADNSIGRPHATIIPLCLFDGTCTGLG